MTCACGVEFSVDYAMVCQHGGFMLVLEAQILRMVSKDVEVEPILQGVTWETLNHGAKKAALTKPPMLFWIFILEAFGSDRDLHFSMFGCITPMQTLTETLLLRRYTRSMRKRRRGKYAGRVMGIEQGTVTPLVFTTTGGMANECVKYHSRLAEVIANKK